MVLGCFAAAPHCVPSACVTPEKPTAPSKGTALPLCRAVVIARVFVLGLLLIVSSACKGADLPGKGVGVGCADCFALRKILHSNLGVLQESITSHLQQRCSPEQTRSSDLTPAAVGIPQAQAMRMLVWVCVWRSLIACGIKAATQITGLIAKLKEIMLHCDIFAIPVQAI